MSHSITTSIIITGEVKVMLTASLLYHGVTNACPERSRWIHFHSEIY